MQYSVERCGSRVHWGESDAQIEPRGPRSGTQGGSNLPSDSLVISHVRIVLVLVRVPCVAPLDC